jgi:predicted methyltransferase
MRHSFVSYSAALALGVALGSGWAVAAAADATPPHVQAAVTDKSRPADDTGRDSNRKPAEMLVFAQIQPGQKVADLLPGGGYFTRLFAKAVGEQGKVYAMVPKELVDKRPAMADPVKALAAAPEYKNVEVLVQPVAQPKAPELLDVIWTAQNYHDLKNDNLGPADVAAVNKAIFDALKPGGVYLVLDHSAAEGSGARDTSTLHRIDPELVKKEVLAAGFVLDAESDVLRNSADERTLRVFDESLRGRTDQFVYRFRKPS